MRVDTIGTFCQLFRLSKHHGAAEPPLLPTCPTSPTPRGGPDRVISNLSDLSDLSTHHPAAETT
eukprot:10651702-Lingulodinium_polyedra.AAC.1